MGKRDTGSDQGKLETGADRQGNGTSTDTKNAGATETGNTASTGATEKERVPQLVAITTDKETGEKKVSKRTQQRRAAAAKKELEQNALSLKPHLKMLLIVSFDMTAKRLGNHWRITDDEAEKVADPLSKILGKYMKASETMEKYADWFGVIGALAMIVIPRLIIHQQIQKEQKKGEKINGPSNIQSSGNGTTGPNTSPRKTAGTSRPSSSQPTANGANGLKDLLTVYA